MFPIIIIDYEIELSKTIIVGKTQYVIVDILP